MVNLVSKNNKELALHVNKVPEHLKTRIAAINQKEFRNSEREVTILLLACALAQFDKLGCKSLTDFLEKSGITNNPLE